MRKAWYLLIAVSGNALGTVLMNSTGLGMTAWGASSSNVANFFMWPLSRGFLLLSVLFYITAILIRKKFILLEMVLSFSFMIGFMLFTDMFTELFPDLSSLHIFLRVIINLSGFFILFFAIAVHIKVNIAVHPMDVYLKEMQIKCNSVKIGSYISYASAFVIAIVFGLLHREITEIGFGTVMTLLFGGILLDFYNKKILYKWKF